MAGAGGGCGHGRGGLGRRGSRGGRGGGHRLGHGHRPGRALLEVAQDVLLRHAAGDARAGQAGDVDAVLGRDLAHDRRGALLAQFLGGQLGARRLGRGSRGRRDWLRRATGGARLGRRRRQGRRRGVGTAAIRTVLGRPPPGPALEWPPREPESARRGAAGGGTGAAATGAGSAREPEAPGGRRAAATASPSAPMTATTVLIGTVVPAGSGSPEHARGRRRDLGVHLVGGDLEQRLVALDLVPDLLHPLGDGALGDRLAHLGHDHVSHGILLRE